MIKHNAIITKFFCCILKEIIKSISIKVLIIFLCLFNLWHDLQHLERWIHNMSYMDMNTHSRTFSVAQYHGSHWPLPPPTIFLFVFLLFLLCHPYHFRHCHQEPCNSYQRDRPWRRLTARLPSSTPACSTTSRLWPACSCSSQRSFPQVSSHRQMTPSWAAL